MKAVRGWVTAKEPVSLKKAARILSSFAARDNLASQDVTNYLKRAAVSFNDLLHFHRELRQCRDPGSFRPEDGTATATAGDGQPSARKQYAGETWLGFGGKEPSKEKKRDKSGGGDKVGIFSKEQQVGGASELLDVEDSRRKGRTSIVAGEMVEVKKSTGKGRKSSMDVAIESFVKVAVEDNGGGEQRKTEKRKNSEEGEEHNKIEYKKRKKSEAEEEQNKKKRKRND